MKTRKTSVLPGRATILLPAICWLVLLPMLLQAQQTNAEFEKELEKTTQLIVMVKAGDAGSPVFGAGIVFGRERDRLLIATAHHVLRSSGQAAGVKVLFRSMPPDKYVDAKLLRYDQEGGKDIAVLSVALPQKPLPDACALPFNRLGKVNKIKRGDAVFSVGNPHGVNWAIPVTADRISLVTGDEIQFQSGFISPGHSGGGLLDGNGRLIGMTTADAQPFGRAINLKTILQLAKKWGYPVQLDTLLPGKRTPLHYAAHAGDLAAIRYHLSDCGNVNAVDAHNATSLHYAAENGNAAALSFLLRSGANPNMLDGDGDLPLQWAIAKKRHECVQLLIKAGTQINTKNKKGETVLHMAVDSGYHEIARMLIEAGADVNVKDVNNYTPLLHAVINKHIETVKMLLQAKADANIASNYDKQPPLFYAIRDNQPELVKTLLKAGAHVNTQDKNGSTPLQLAVNYNRRYGDEKQAFPKSMLDIIYALLGAGAKTELKDEHGHTPIFYALDNKHAELVRLLGTSSKTKKELRGDDAVKLMHQAIYYSEDLVKVLIASGVDVNARNSSDGETALTMAPRNAEKLETIKILLNAGARVNVKDKRGWTPLHYASLRGCDSSLKVPTSDVVSCLKMLIEAGADVNAKNVEGKTPLYTAGYYNTTHRKEIEKLLRLHGAN